MTCSLAASMQEVTIFSEHILKNGSVWTSYCSLCCVLRTISHANYWMQSWYVAQLTHHRYNILQSYVGWVSCLFSLEVFLRLPANRIYYLFHVIFSSSKSAWKNGWTKWWSLEPPWKWGEFVTSSELIMFSYISIKKLKPSFRYKLKVSATLQDSPRADRYSVSCFYKNPYKPYIF